MQRLKSAMNNSLNNSIVQKTELNKIHWYFSNNKPKLEMHFKLVFESAILSSVVFLNLKCLDDIYPISMNNSFLHNIDDE